MNRAIAKRPSSVKQAKVEADPMQMIGVEPLQEPILRMGQADGPEEGS